MTRVEKGIAIAAKTINSTGQNELDKIITAGRASISCANHYGLPLAFSNANSRLNPCLAYAPTRSISQSSMAERAG